MLSAILFKSWSIDVVLLSKNRFNITTSLWNTNFLFAGLEKNLNSSLPFGQVALKFCFPGQVFGYSFYNLVGRWLAWAPTHRASENEKWLARQENLLVPDNRTALFSSPVFVLAHLNGPWTKNFALFVFCHCCFLHSELTVTRGMMKTIPF